MMTLETLANEIAAQAEAQAAAIVSTAKTQAAQIEADARVEAQAAAENQQARAERESAQLSVEVVASARQANQKQQLIARREELDATWNAAREQVGSADLSGRAGLLDSLLAEAKSAGGDMILRPVAIDRNALKSGGFTLGNDVDGLGGFVLESTDGSIILDYCFDSRLEEAWKANLGAVNEALFGN